MTTQNDAVHIVAPRSTSTGGITLHTAHSGDNLAAVQQLCLDYRTFLLDLPGVSVEVTSMFRPLSRFDALLDTLPTLHARPTGTILLARDTGGTAVGCGMSHPLNPNTCEIKRVFVSPSARGKRVAEQLCQALVDQAQADGFARVVLDTHTELHAAQALYLRMGFTARGPYQPIPDAVLPELLFFEKPLPSTA